MIHIVEILIFTAHTPDETIGGGARAARQMILVAFGMQVRSRDEDEPGKEGGDLGEDVKMSLPEKNRFNRQDSDANRPIHRKSHALGNIPLKVLCRKTDVSVLWLRRWRR